MNSNLSDPAFWSRLQKSVDQEGTRESSLNANLAFGSFSITPGRILAFLITVSYYITAGKGPSYDRARLASNWDSLSRDEDVRYYLKQLEGVAKLFDEFTPDRSRQGILL